MCDACDAKLEKELQGQYLNELCDCDRARRWLCWHCWREQYEETSAMYDRNTVTEHDDDRYDELWDHTKRMADHQFRILVSVPVPHVQLNVLVLIEYSFSVLVAHTFPRRHGHDAHGARGVTGLNRNGVMSLPTSERDSNPSRYALRHRPVD